MNALSVNSELGASYPVEHSFTEHSAGRYIRSDELEGTGALDSSNAERALIVVVVNAFHN